MSCTHETSRSIGILQIGRNGFLSRLAGFAAGVLLTCGCRSGFWKSNESHGPYWKSRDPYLDEAVQQQADYRKARNAELVGQAIFWIVYGKASPEPD